MDRSPFAPFSMSAAPLFAAPSNPFRVSVEEERAAAATDAVWAHDTTEADDDAPTADALDVRILWGTNVLFFEQMSPPRPFTLGGVGSDFTLPSAADDAGACDLVVLHEQSARVHVAAGGAAEVRLVNGRVLSLRDCIAQGLAAASPSGGHDLALPHGALASIRLPESELVFEVTRARARREPDRGLFAGADFSGQIYTGLSALAHASVIGALAFFLPTMRDDDAEAIDRDTAAAMRPYLEALAEKEPEKVENPGAGETSPSSGGGKGSAAEKESGTMGSTTSASHTPARYAIRGDEAEPKLQRDKMLVEAAKFGMVGLLNTDSNASSTPAAPWAELVAAGSDPRSANGTMWAATIDDAFGAGGLGLTSTGEGGGGSAHGIGMNGIGSTIGHGMGNCTTGDCTGIGNDHGFGPGGPGSHGGPGGMPGHDVRVPILHPATITSNGSLPREVIQRVVRENFGRFRLCYEGGLRKNPGLTGRVAVDFVIARDGSVAVASADRSTEMADDDVTACVVRGFHNLSFPAPSNGMVTVVYPLMLSPGE